MYHLAEQGNTNHTFTPPAMEIMALIAMCSMDNVRFRDRLQQGGDGCGGKFQFGEGEHLLAEVFQ